MLSLTVAECPGEIDGARVICYTRIDSRHEQTGNTRHTVEGQPLGPASGLAICQYVGDTAFYLFSCDATWSCITDTSHQSLEEAQNQAEFEYVGASGTWIFKVIMHLDSKLPNDQQRKQLADMLHHAFVEIRALSWTGRAEQAAALADAFHNLPQEMWREYFSVSYFRQAFLQPYVRRWPRGPFDYMAMLEKVEKLR